MARIEEVPWIFCGEEIKWNVSIYKKNSTNGKSSTASVV